MKKTAVLAFSPSLTSEEKARIKATLGVLALARIRMPTRLPDADELPDPMMEFVGSGHGYGYGYSAVRHDIVAKPTGCIDCTQRSEACDNCELSGDGKEDEGERHFARLVAFGAFAKWQRDGAYLGQMLQVGRYHQLLHDALHDLSLSAPRFRGARLFADLQVSRRMKL